MTCFSLHTLRLHLRAANSVRIPSAGMGNLVRGQFGKTLWYHYPDAYAKYFAPIRDGAGPSGFRDLPRPFVLRVRGLDGREIESGKALMIGANLFEELEPPVILFREVLGQVACEALGGAHVERVDQTRIDIALEPSSTAVHRLRVQFLTPTELKGSDRPEFGVLFARIRDRVSMLRSLYGSGPLDIDFAGLGNQANEVRMTRCDLRRQNVQRRSGSQKAVHSIGGFVGFAEYEGELTAFLPYFEAAQWTGVGRQTVWGKGEIHSEAY
jgi:hypothetical protein